MSKAKKILLGIAAGLLAYPIVMALFAEPVRIKYLPFVDSISVHPLLLMLLCYAAGALSVLVWRMFRGGKKKEPPFSHKDVPIAPRH